MFQCEYFGFFMLVSCLFLCLQNLVMFLSVLVDWMIPDIPKDISEQIKKEKTVLVDFFLKEEHEKLKLIESFIARDKRKRRSGTKSKRTRAASFSQCQRSPKGSFTSFSSQHTVV